jgi:hypothetical protein
VTGFNAIENVTTVAKIEIKKQTKGECEREKRERERERDRNVILLFSPSSISSIHLLSFLYLALFIRVSGWVRSGSTW